MTHRNQWQRDWREGLSDELERALDAALAKYTAVEPRAGLEDRILASLHAGRARRTDRAWWQWTLAGALTAIVVIVSALAWRWAKPAPQLGMSHPSMTIQSPQLPGVQGAHPDVSATSRHPHPGIRKTAKSEVAEVANPRLDQFPSPQPLSEQENILASYAAQFHKQAVLIARLADEELQRDRMEVIGKQPGVEFAESGDQETTNR